MCEREIECYFMCVDLKESFRFNTIQLSWPCLWHKVEYQTFSLREENLVTIIVLKWKGKSKLLVNNSTKFSLYWTWTFLHAFIYVFLLYFHSLNCFSPPNLVSQPYFPQHLYQLPRQYAGSFFPTHVLPRPFIKTGYPKDHSSGLVSTSHEQKLPDLVLMDNSIALVLDILARVSLADILFFYS